MDSLIKLELETIKKQVWCLGSFTPDMGFSVVVSDMAKENFRQHLDYVGFTLENYQAVKSTLADYKDTLEQLSQVADGLQISEDPDLKKRGYRTIRFKHHRLLMVYRIEGKTVYVDGIYHMLQDYQNIFRNFLIEP